MKKVKGTIMDDKNKAQPTAQLSVPAKSLLVGIMTIITLALLAIPLYATSVHASVREPLLLKDGNPSYGSLIATKSMQDSFGQTSTDASKDTADDKTSKAGKDTKDKTDKDNSKASEDTPDDTAFGYVPDDSITATGQGGTNAGGASGKGDAQASGSGGSGGSGGAGGGNTQGTWHPGWTEVVHHPAEYEEIWHDEVGHYAAICSVCGEITGDPNQHLLDTGHGSWYTGYVVDSPAWSERVQTKAAWDESVNHPGYWG